MTEKEYLDALDKLESPTYSKGELVKFIDSSIHADFQTLTSTTIHDMQLTLEKVNTVMELTRIQGSIAAIRMLHVHFLTALADIENKEKDQSDE